MKSKLFRTFFVAALLLTVVVSAAGAAPSFKGEPDLAGQVDYRMDPFTSAQAEQKVAAMNALLNGKAYGKTHEVARGQYVELAREGEDPILTVLGDFPDLPHNSLPEPDRTVDNSTIWVEDFGRDYYMGILFDEGKSVNSMRQFYIENSANRYAVYGDVTDWITVSGPAASYDDDKTHPSGGNAVWYFLDESVDGWYDAQIAAGKSPAEINDYLNGFDVWDRYDADGDGNFDEPDGYIDHMQFVHSGEGNEAGGGVLGDDAIWSHSWYAFYLANGPDGPGIDYYGGVKIGDSDFWVGKYTIQPENGGVGVFAHEYGHDLGLPDLYDYTGENSTGFWTIMSSGSWLSQNNYDIGSQPNHFGVWEKFQLGWLNYEVAVAGTKSEHKLGPAEYNTKQAQGLFVILPDKEVVEQIAEPVSGEYFYYSGAGNELDNWMTKEFTLAAGSSITAQVQYDIEYGWDYAYLVVSSDGGATWENVASNLSDNDDPEGSGQNLGNGITGSSGGWVELTADLSAYTGDVLLGFRYWTDAYVVNPGFMVDNIQITGYELDDAESEAGWNFEGFSRTTGTESAFYSNYYVAEFRQYRGFDAGLANAYNFVGGNWVEHFPYQDGLLVSYWDNSFTDNNVGSNCAAGRCGGLLLPVDAHPDLMYCEDGSIFRNRIQTFDATFGLEPTDEITVHCKGEPSTFPSQPAVKVFDDRNSYYNPENPMGSVIVPNTGTQIRVKSVSAQGTFMQVQVRPAK